MSVMTPVTDWRAPVVDFKAPAARPTRGHLRLVPDMRASTTSSSVRITRRGRLAMTILVALGCLVGAFMGIRGLTAADAATPVFQVVEVRPGQTLSGIAHQAYPSLSVRDGVARIQLANNLNTNQVFGGEQLRLPR